jgi:predicted DCC family thiol-disulfide oxidoreductase YuxK
LALLPLADEQAERLLSAVSEEDRLECWWLILRDGTPVPGNQGGGVMLLAELRLTRPLAVLLRALRLSPLVDFLDDVLARHRSGLGRFIPDGPALRRYP